METISLQVTKRELTGKKVRFLRREGITPVHLFGHSVDSQALQCDTAALQKAIQHAGMTRPIDIMVEGEKQAKSVFIREIQQNHVTKKLIHVDFYQLRKGDKIKMDIPIIIIGEAPALKVRGRMLAHGLNALHVESLPENLPSQIEVDVSGLEEPEQAIHVSDIILGADVTVHADPEQMVVKVSEALVKQVEDEIAEAEAEAGVEAVEMPAAEAEAETTEE